MIIGQIRPALRRPARHCFSCETQHEHIKQQNSLLTAVAPLRCLATFFRPRETTWYTIDWLSQSLPRKKAGSLTSRMKSKRECQDFPTSPSLLQKSNWRSATWTFHVGSRSHDLALAVWTSPVVTLAWFDANSCPPSWNPIDTQMGYHLACCHADSPFTTKGL